MIFRDREDAAQLLAEKLSADYKNKNALVLGIPRGAVPMAKIIAEALGGELDIVLVHKLSHPDQPELAIGAIDEDGNAFISNWAADLEEAYLESEKKRQLEVMRRRRAAYTPDRVPVDAKGRIVIVVDDGIATGSTMVAALRAVRARKPKKLIAAVAVASPEGAQALARECDRVICLTVPAHFYAVGQVFEDFAQVTDEDVMKTLRRDRAPLAERTRVLFL
jgi:putative phosphoribosyl transferase